MTIERVKGLVMRLYSFSKNSSYPIKGQRPSSLQENGSHQCVSTFWASCRVTDDGYPNLRSPDLRYGPNTGHPTTAIPKVVRPSQRKGVQSTKTKFVRSVIREVAGFSPYERRVMELLRNSKVRACFYMYVRDRF